MTAPASRPNFLLLVGEDTGSHLGCFGDRYAQTPNLDRLASEGVRFTNAFSHAPVCAPSRGALVTGQYPWSVGVHQMRSTLLDPPRLFTHELVAAGYDVQWPTKLDFNFDPTEGWCSGTKDWWKDGLPSDQPFFAYRNVACTHESQMWTPASDRERWAETEIEEWANPDDVPVPPYLPDLPEVRTQIARYYENLKYQDVAWGECLAALDASGQGGNTIVIYLTDHGRGLPREKRWCYDAGIHLPLIVRWPGHLKAGGVRDELVSWVDLAPTILRLAGIPVPPRLQGRDFLAEGERDYHFAGRDRMDEAYDCQRACRSKDWHYVRNYFPEIPFARRNRYQEQGEAVMAMRKAWAAGKLAGDAAVWFSAERAEEELFEVANDPHCLHNVAEDPDNASVLAEHREALDAHLAELGDWGAVREQVMVDRGLVEDLLAKYTAQLGPLPDSVAVEPAQTSVEMPRPRADAERVAPPAGRITGIGE